MACHHQALIIVAEIGEWSVSDMAGRPDLCTLVTVIGMCDVQVYENQVLTCPQCLPTSRQCLNTSSEP
jgi:hypothetical protein